MTETPKAPLVSSHVDVLVIDNLTSIISSITREIDFDAITGIESSHSAQYLIKSLSDNDRVEAAKKTLNLVLTLMADLFGYKIIDGMVSTRNQNPVDARDAVLSWVSLITPLTDIARPDSISRYLPEDFDRALRSLKPEILQDALWAPDKAQAGNNAREIAIARLTALNLEQSMVDYGHNSTVVRRAIEYSFGAPWDTIRKWSKSSRLVVGEELSDILTYDPIKKDALFVMHSEWPIMNLMIQISGDHYRRLIGHVTAKRFEGFDDLKEMVGRMQLRANGTKNQISQFRKMSKELNAAVSLALGSKPS